MKQRPILMSGPLVREILAGNKTQTRRPIKPQPESQLHNGNRGHSTIWVPHPWNINEYWKCPYGSGKGDQLWVRETWQHTKCLNLHPTDENYGYVYRADQQPWEDYEGWTWKPSIFMPKQACRLFLEIQDIRVERLQDISEEDAKAEGAEAFKPNIEGLIPSYKVGFFNKWMEIYGKDVAANPWVWAIDFRRVES